MGQFDLRLDRNVDHILSRAKRGHMTLNQLRRVRLEEKPSRGVASLAPLLGLFAAGFCAVNALCHVFA